MDDLFVDYASGNTSYKTYDGHALVQQNWKALSNDGDDISSDIANSLFMESRSPAMLPFAAEKYNISPNLADYVIVPANIIISDIPNRNGRAFPLSTLTQFNPEYGTLSYQTWRYKPTFYEHDNKDHTKAKGIIFDVSLRPMPWYKGDFYSVDMLLGFDRTKDPVLANRIANRDIKTYSMGSRCSDYRCSICDASMRLSRGQCPHCAVKPSATRPPVRVIDGKLAYLNIAEDLCGFECSAVEVPAVVQAASDTVYT